MTPPPALSLDLSLPPSLSFSLPLSDEKPQKFTSTFHSFPSFLCRRTFSFRDLHLSDDRRGSAGAVRSWPTSPARRPVIVEITRWKSIGDALAPIWTKRPFPGVNRYFYKRERPIYGPTTCLSAGAEGGVRILWNIPGDSSKSALLQWRPAPPTAAGSLPITVVGGAFYSIRKIPLK